MSNNFIKELIILIDNFQLENISKQILKDDLHIKKFFGGGAVYARNRIFMTLTNVGLGLKLSENDLKKVMKIGGKELRYFPKGHIKRQYVIIPENVIRSSKDLSLWINKSIDFVLVDI